MCMLSSQRLGGFKARYGLLRPHQKLFDNHCKSILSGSPIKTINIYAKPGSGKSLLPAIASQLIIDDSYKICWLVPRDSLRTQGESDFTGSGHYDVGDKDIRAADGSGDPIRDGVCGCISTYQSVSANPEKFINLSKKYKLILFLDEYDSLIGESQWSVPVREMYDSSFLRVCMTGTINRSDSQQIEFTPYDENGMIDFSETDERKWIIYDTKQALKDGSILPLDATLIQGSGSYVDLDGITRRFDKFTGKGDELRCASMTEYSEQLFHVALNHWNEYRKRHPWSKFLVIATNISIAKQYHEWFNANGHNFAIATSEDSEEAKNIMRQFKKDNSQFGSYDGLVSVNMIYKGMNCPQCTHMVVLTNIRGEAYLDQAFGRVQRRFKDKTHGYLFGPDDPRLREVLKNLSAGVIHDATAEPPEKKGTYTPDEETGPARTIQALESRAHIDIPQPDLPPITEHHETQSEIEKRLRSQINSIVNAIVMKEDAGNRKTKQRILFLRIRQAVNSGRDDNGRLIKKSFDEMSIKELNRVKDLVKMF